jgi:hypothetical protein
MVITVAMAVYELRKLRALNAAAAAVKIEATVCQSRGWT